MIELIIALNSRVTVRVAEETEKEAWRKAALWMDMPSVCPICGSEIALMRRRPKDLEFFGLRCLGPIVHEGKVSERKDGSGLYYQADAQWRVFGGGGYCEEMDEPDGMAAHATSRVERRPEPAAPPRAADVARTKETGPARSYRSESRAAAACTCKASDKRPGEHHHPECGARLAPVRG